ncbi:SDR family NAD(P)-dependent oxidoreductase [Herbiconiux ginsengi]|uniref:NAD(P)-dependent dehydrogenase, short-chain alcohol dehydrogenase family n=1 Tax=Herbiconiux ginsengi TaxID=381665 RepID=A0A1H3TFS9_9MICO|nr:SDR family oxidoreductase [Herbiconiux ginsengi]SDZ49104.1 NAD(P)-dependent dehydrogenase, short-chain alcohol dehydrogenase family [Herbiconiux ginsengi]
MNRFEGKRIAVIGAAPGQIGGAIVARLAAEGARVYIGGRDVSRLQVTADLAGRDRIAGVAAVDLADADSTQAFVDGAAEALGGLDGFVNNAAMYGADDTDIVSVDLGLLDTLLEVNLRGQVFTARFAIPHLIAAGGGSIVMTSSIAGIKGEPTRVTYGIAKSGLFAVARHVSARWGKQGVRCNIVIPGRIVTGNIPEAEEPMLQPFLRRVASPRLGTPEDIASATAFLLSEDAGFINGTSILVDGGMTEAIMTAPLDDDDFYHRLPFSKSELGLG